MGKDNPDPPAPKQWATVSPREAIRYRYRAGFGGAEADRGASDDTPQYPPAGAMIDYWMASAAPTAQPRLISALEQPPPKKFPRSAARNGTQNASRLSSNLKPRETR